MYRRWPFFRNFLANVQQALVKANMEIAKEYSDLRRQGGRRSRIRPHQERV